jgi:hypothetical protein
MVFAIARQKKWFLLFLFLAGFFIRALVFQCYLSKDNNYWQIDSETYERVAERIVEGKGITNVDGSPQFYRLPGYPLFLALYYKLFGVDTKNVLWMQIVLASFIPILIFFLSLTLFPGALLLAKIAGCFSVLHLGFVLYAGFFMTESLFIFLLLLFLILFFSTFQFGYKNAEDDNKKYELPLFSFLPVDEEDSGPDFFALHDAWLEDYYKKIKTSFIQAQDNVYEVLFFAGFVLGLASLVRPVGHYLFVVSCLLLLLSSDRWREKGAKIFILGWGWLIPVSFWLLRNYMLAGSLFFHTLPGVHFLYLSAARVAMHVHDVPYQEARDLLRKEVNELMEEREEEKGSMLNEIERCQIHEQLAVKYFKMQPWYALKYWLTDIMRTCLSLYSAELLYLDSGRKEINYFEKGRSIGSLFKRYLIPQTDNNFLKIIIYAEIILFLFILIGLIFSLRTMMWQWFFMHNWLAGDFLCKCLPFMCLFIVIALAGGYARMRLPIEPLMIIFAWRFWLSCIKIRECNDVL